MSTKTRRADPLFALYAEQRWPLVLNVANGKRPLIKDWGSTPPLTLTEARAALAAGQNIGVRLGPESGLIDVECDTPAAERAARKMLGDTAIPTFRSRRGLHRFFRYDTALDGCKSSTPKIGGVEFRVGSNGKATQSLLPPSTTDGHTREWLVNLSPADIAPAPLPVGVIEKLIAAGKNQSDPAGTPAHGVVLKGKRDSFLISLGGLLRRHGAEEAGLATVLQAANTALCAPPLDEKQVTEKARSAAGYNPAETGDIPPWPREVDGARLLAAIEKFIRRYVVLPEGSAFMVAAWTMAAWCIDGFDRFPHLALTSPTKRCGKTRLLQVLALVTPRPRFAASVSPPVLYRIVEAQRPTLLLDEAQQLEHRDENSKALKCLMNAGVDRNATALRMGGANFDQVMEFRVYSPKVVALIGQLDGTLADRCLSVRMFRKTASDKAAPFRSRTAEAEGKPLARKLARWSQDNAERLAKLYDESQALPLENDRLAELLLPLQAVVKLIAPSRLRELERVARGLDKADTDADAPGIKLLAALREVVTVEFMETADIIKELMKRREEPWHSWNHGFAISAHALGRLLRAFDIKPRHNKQRTARGYRLDDLQPVFVRYLPPLNKASRPSRPSKAEKSKHAKTLENKA